jgi:sugar phosphate isomerase/epimerase
MKFAVFTAMLTEFSPEETIDKLAASGWDGVEWAVKMDDDDGGYSFKWSRAIRDGPAIAERVQEAGLETAGVNFDVLGPDTPEEQVRQAIKVAAGLGAVRMRFGMPNFGGNSPDGPPDKYRRLFDRTADKLASAVEIAASHGVKQLIECHFGTITPSAALALRLAERYSPEQVGVILDPGNQVVEGFENWELEIELLGDYLAHVHAKNARWDHRPGSSAGRAGLKSDWARSWVALDSGMADWSFVLRALQAAGYDGWIGMEDFSDTPTSDKLGQIELLRNWSGSGP